MSPIPPTLELLEAVSSHPGLMVDGVGFWDRSLGSMGMGLTE